MNLKRFARLAPLLALLALIIAACECGTIAPLPEHWSYTATPSLVPLFELPVTRTPTAVVQALIIEATPQCPMTWQAPEASAVMPKNGRVGFDWSPHPGASAYKVVLTQPDGTEIVYESPMDYKELFMENYLQGGEYTVEIQAFDANGNLLCSIAMKFKKDEPAANPGAQCYEVCKPDPGCSPTVACAQICTTVCK